MVQFLSLNQSLKKTMVQFLDLTQFGISHGCSNHSDLEMETKCLTKNLSYFNSNISRTKNGRNKVCKVLNKKKL